MTVTLQDLLDDANDNLEDWPEDGSSTIEPDGYQTRFHLPDKFILENTVGMVIIAANEAQTYWSEDPTLQADNSFSVNYKTSWLTTKTAPVQTTTAEFAYLFKHWPDELLTRYINNSLSFLFPSFYARRTASITADSSTYDYAVTDDDDLVPLAITEVALAESGSMSTRLTPNRDYRVLRPDVETANLRVFSPPSSGTIEVTFAARPRPFAELTDTLGDLGLPDSMREAIGCYTCWKALAQKMPARTRTDTVSNYQNEGMITFSDQTRSVQLWKILLDAEVEANKMRHWVAKGI